MGTLRIYTIGHSTRSIDELVGLLQEHGVLCVIDVRRFPGSRRHPQFAQDALRASLAHAGIEYLHKVDLGGRRSSSPDSINTAWRNASFRAYADYAGTSAFSVALEQVIAHASVRGSALLCAEVLPHRCHRRLIADALVVRGAEVIHILGPRRSEIHRLSPDARVQKDGHIIYPGTTQTRLPLLGDLNAGGRRDIGPSRS